MDSIRFAELLQQVHEKEKELLGRKAGEYSKNDDRIYNFREGAKMMGCSPPETAWAYLTKHLISIQRAVSDEVIDFSWGTLWENGSYSEGTIQKIIDARNYLFLLLCCLEVGNGTKAEFSVRREKDGSLD